MKRHILGFSMHHIYADSKKESVTTLASLNNLNGLYLFGKPGRVVVEGSELGTQRYEHQLCRLRWQKCRVQARAVRDGGDGGPPLFDGFRPVDSLAELEHELRSRGLDDIWTGIQRPFNAPVQFMMKK